MKPVMKSVIFKWREKVMSAIFHTPMEADGIVFDTDGTVCMNVVKYDICI